ncbi:hypothetical protein AB0K48_51635 [Nonomuraea sp. NPDC055795]
MEALEQVKKDAADGVGGQRLAGGVTVYDSDPFFLHVRGYGDTYCLDNFASGNGAAGSPVGFWLCNGGNTERWRWRLFSSEVYAGYELVNYDSGRCLSYPPNIDVPGAQMIVDDCRDGVWLRQAIAIYFHNGGLVLDFRAYRWGNTCLDGFSSAWRGNGSPVGLWICDPKKPNVYQLWF